MRGPLGAASGVVLRGASAAPEPEPEPNPIVIQPIPNPITPQPRGDKRPSKPRRGSRSRASRRLQRTVLLRGKVRRSRGGKVRVVVKRQTASGPRTVRHATARVARNGRFTRLVRNLKPARYVVVARYSKRSGTAVPLRTRHFKIRY